MIEPKIVVMTVHQDVTTEEMIEETSVHLDVMTEGTIADQEETIAAGLCTKRNVPTDLAFLVHLAQDVTKVVVKILKTVEAATDRDSTVMVEVAIELLEEKVAEAINLVSTVKLDRSVKIA